MRQQATQLSDAEVNELLTQLREALEHIYAVAEQIWGHDPDDTCMREARAAIAKAEAEAEGR